jgi:hypothetical protein
MEGLGKWAVLVSYSVYRVLGSVGSVNYLRSWLLEVKVVRADAKPR